MDLKNRIKNKPLSPVILPSVTLKTYLNLNPTKKSKLETIISSFNENGFALSMILFSLPIAIPLPWPPGVASILGTPLLIFAVQMILGYKKVRLPKKISNFKIKHSTLITLAKKAIPSLEYIELRLKPRLFFAESVYCEQFIGLISLICCIAILIPLPLTNAIPALGILIMSLGLLKRDGLVIILGVIVGLIGVIIAFIAISLSFIALKSLLF